MRRLGFWTAALWFLGCIALAANVALSWAGGLLTVAVIVLAFMIVRRELGRRERAEEGLRAGNAALSAAQRQTADALSLLDGFVMNAPIGLAFLDSELRFVRINKYLAEANRLPVEEHLGRPLEQVLPRLPPTVAEDMRGVLRDGKPVLGRLVEDTGTEPGVRPVWQSNYYPVRDAAGAIIGVGLAALDVTERLVAEEGLRESRGRFRVLTEALPQKILTATSAGAMDYANRRWAEFTGIAAEAAREGGWQDAIHPDDRALAAEAWRHSLQTAQPFDAELRLREAAAGDYRWHLASALPVLDARGRVAQWVVTLTDISDQKAQAETLEQLVNERTDALRATNRTLLSEVEERKRAEEREQAVAVELRRSNEELEKFAYVASHDLQEPLRKIQAFGDRLRTKSRDALGEQGREYLDRMLNSAGRMRALINDLLTFSRVSTRPQALATVDLNVVVADALSDLEERVTNSGARVDLGPLPTLEADPTQMRQLFQNLIGNALKFNTPGVPPEVVVEASPDGDSWRISVADNGIGFDEKYLDRIFQVFQRLHGRSDYEGTGIGLAVCRKIVERHGGTITARSAPGGGSTFIITLPARQPDRADGAASGGRG